MITGVAATSSLSSHRGVLLSHVDLENLVDEVELDNRRDELSTFFGVPGKLSAIGLGNESGKLLAIFDELDARLEQTLGYRRT